MLNSVSFVQGRGRARQENSDFIVLSERSDRTTETFANVEKQQLEMIRTFKPKYVKGKPSEIDLIAQKSREQSAKKFLMENIINNNNCIGILNNFCSKTKVPLKETCIQDGLDWVVSLFYQSTTMDLCASSVSVSKANAKKDASIQIISQIITNLE